MHTTWKFKILENDELLIGEIARQINNLIVLYTEPKNTEADATLILQNIWLGNHIAANNYNFVASKRIKHVINITDDIPNVFPFLDYTTFSIKDITACHSNLLQKIDYCASIIHNVVAENKPILIHCKRGHHRSASVIAYYLMKYCNMTLIDAVRLIKMNRPTAFRRINCMMKTLIYYEKNKVLG
jgi:protein tyrosine phosphatase